MSVLHEVELWRGEDNDTTDKFMPPALSVCWARRDRLERLVSLAVQHPLTLITGSPGAGKTVLLSDSPIATPTAWCGGCRPIKQTMSPASSGAA